jgi:hypothetical protein
MFPAIMPWPMTLTPTNEAVRCENCAEKTLIWKKLTVTIREVMEDVRIVQGYVTDSCYIQYISANPSDRARGALTSVYSSSS